MRRSALLYLQKRYGERPICMAGLGRELAEAIAVQDRGLTEAAQSLGLLGIDEADLGRFVDEWLEARWQRLLGSSE